MATSGEGIQTGAEGVHHFESTSLLLYVLVGMLWGCTNPYIKRAQMNAASSLPHSLEVKERRQGSNVPGSGGMGNNSTVNSNIFIKTLAPLRRLLSDPLVLGPYLINQSGSIVFFYVLSKEPVTRAAPLCNALAFVFTAITGCFFLGEDVKSPVTLSLGVALVVLGTHICLMS